MHAAWPARTADRDHEVAEFLRANPGWLAAHPELYRTLLPPVRVHGEPMADHMAAMLRQERCHARTMTEQAEAVLAAGRAVAATLERVHAAVLSLLAADDVLECLIADLPPILGADAIGLCTDRGVCPHSAGGELAELEAVLSGRDVVFRREPGNAAALYQEAAPLARHDALIRVPGIGVMGVASRHSLWNQTMPAQRGLQFLGQVTATVLIAARGADPDARGAISPLGR